MSAQWFSKSGPHYYPASTKRGQHTSLWIDAKILDKVRIVAKHDAVYINRVNYTALVLYLEDKKLKWVENGRPAS